MHFSLKVVTLQSFGLAAKLQSSQLNSSVFQSSVFANTCLRGSGYLEARLPPPSQVCLVTNEHTSNFSHAKTGCYKLIGTWEWRV